MQCLEWQNRETPAASPLPQAQTRHRLPARGVKNQVTRPLKPIALQSPLGTNLARAVGTVLPSRRAVLAVGVASLAATCPAAASDEPKLAGQAVFDEVWQTVQQHSFDPRFNGLDWPAVRARHRPALLAAGSPDARAAVIKAMLAELHASHTEYLLRILSIYFPTRRLTISSRISFSTSAVLICVRSFLAVRSRILGLACSRSGTNRDASSLAV